MSVAAVTLLTSFMGQHANGGHANEFVVFLQLMSFYPNSYRSVSADTPKPLPQPETLPDETLDLCRTELQFTRLPDYISDVQQGVEEWMREVRDTAPSSV